MTTSLAFKIYAVRNATGEFFRAVGYGVHWVADPERARLYPRLSQARARVTFYANLRPTEPRLVIVEFTADNARDLDETERLAKVVERERVKRETREVRARRLEVEAAHRALRAAEEKLRKLGVSMDGSRT